ncbi:unnamed protein product [Onchocerca flexuosa]|uniref:Ovule protein n=1 Tax=Onchocerca flexuosa TaxID=387005 RepID=A0A183H9M5_9BILA|nr:unnamed protein product [Onchocerca flexuosa]
MELHDITTKTANLSFSGAKKDSSELYWKASRRLFQLLFAQRGNAHLLTYCPVLKSQFSVCYLDANRLVISRNTSCLQKQKCQRDNKRMTKE